MVQKGYPRCVLAAFKALSRSDSSMLSSFLRETVPTTNPYGRPSTTRNVIIRTHVSDGNLRGRKVEPSIRIGDVLFEGGLTVCKTPCPSFLMEVTHLPPFGYHMIECKGHVTTSPFPRVD